MITDDIVERAHGDLQEALGRAAKARAQLSEAEKDISDLQAFLRTLKRYATPAVFSGAREHVANTGLSPAGMGSRGRNLVDVCICAIRKSGRPLKIGELLDIVLKAGIAIGGMDQKSNLAGYLSRDSRVETRGRSVGWDVVETVGIGVQRSVKEDSNFGKSEIDGQSGPADTEEMIRRKLFGEP